MRAELPEAPRGADYEIVIEPFMLECTKQKKVNVPALLNTRLRVVFGAMLPFILQPVSSVWTPWGAVSLFFQVTTCPTLASTGLLQVKSATDASTSVAGAACVTSVHRPAAWVAAGAVVPAAVVPAAAVGAVVGVLPEHAARRRTAADRVPKIRVGDRIGLLLGAGWCRAVSRHDSATGRRSSYGSTVAGDRILDPELARRLVLHEARAQQTPARELRDLGDGWLFHDPNDAEPFWNRVIAPVWPAETRAFDRRLDEMITLFATLGRLPHVRPLPVGGAPADLASRLAAAGFETVGADRRMVLAEPERIPALVAATEARVAAALGGATVRVTRQAVETGRPAGRASRANRRGSRIVAARRAWPERRHWATDASIVLAESFGVGEARRLALENDVLACVSRPGCSMLLLDVDGEPAAVARRASTADASYLSSIGTRPGFRGRGLGALATLLAVCDALDAGEGVVHLAVDVGNEAARRLYERLGFTLVGDPAPDLLLH